MIWHLAALWEAIADAVPGEIALINGAVKRSWADYDRRAARLATALAAAGLGRDAKVAVYGLNSNEFLEAHFAVFKVRGVPINVNYRYSEAELIYLFDNADVEAVVFDAQFGERLGAILPRLPKVRLTIEIDDGSGRHLEAAALYEELIAAHPPMARASYDEDDVYMLYTGGTTGMPKGVMYPHSAISQALMLGYDLRGETRPTTPAALAETVRRRRDAAALPVSLAASPLMHGTGLWGGAFVAHNLGGAAVTIRSARFDADELWRVVERERISDMAIVGDVFARPMLAALRAASAAGRPYDVTSLKMMFSSGVMFTREVKQGLLEFIDMTILDSMGATEGGMATSIVNRATPAALTAVFQKNPTTKVFDADDREIQPGSDETGMVANGGAAPIGYYKDPAKSAATFRVIDGHRYSFPGDFAKVAADGTLILLGRGSSCINTGGEKVYPEEVEEALKAHPDVEDCLVVGVPDDRFGERVTAVLSARSGRAIDTAAVLDLARLGLAGYKVPKAVVLVDEVRRLPNGKADITWAKAVAREAVG
ncbi:MAG TPA: AMP-binding protein [Caulobacteraceae bacterium]|nr:AMP-binding protein [Caulobacteraceae bacterium]